MPVAPQDAAVGPGIGTRSDEPADRLAVAGSSGLVDVLSFDAAGLVPAVVQDHDTREVLMVAWMNAEAVAATLREGRTVFWSRSRGELWRKGETSGDVQLVREVRVDCDEDTLLVLVDQQGHGACHTGSRTCFFRSADEVAAGTGRPSPNRTDPAP
jgi:phosphoribosyl-AMP cyclohydrolase